ncbi:MAG: arginase [Chloroflexota bacterium]|nr:arginase [Chloroflexota bacterium]
MTPMRDYPVRIYGVPMDLGQKRRGVDMGPSAIRYAELQRILQHLDYNVYDGGNLYAPIREEIARGVDDDPSEGIAYNMLNIGQVCQTIYDESCRSIAAGETCIFLGGDHSVSIGTVAAALTRSPKVGVLWIDAHGDYNTPQTSPSGSVHGMVVAALSGKCPPALTIGAVRLRPDQLVMIGTRDLDPGERDALIADGVKVLTMRSIDENGMATAVHAALNALGDVDTLHISLDMDSLDPTIAPGVGTPVPGGLSYREAHLLMEMLADDGRVRSLDIVEVNPILDTANRTAQIAVELTAGLFGKRIL